MFEPPFEFGCFRFGDAGTHGHRLVLRLEVVVGVGFAGAPDLVQYVLGQAARWAFPDLVVAAGDVGRVAVAAGAVNLVRHSATSTPSALAIALAVAHGHGERPS